MPRGDGTGPMGMGPMTGRGSGFCAGFRTPGYMNFIPGRGKGLTRRGRRRSLIGLGSALLLGAYFARRGAKRNKKN